MCLWPLLPQIPSFVLPRSKFLATPVQVPQKLTVTSLVIIVSKESQMSVKCCVDGLNAVLMRRQSCVEAYAEDAQAPASSFGSEKEGSLSKA